MRIIETDADVAEGASWLAAQDARFAKALRLTGPLPLRRHEGGFHQLLSAIVSQQVSVASARAIMARLMDAGLTEELVIRNTTEDDLRSAGLSRQKARYAKALAEAQIDYDALQGATDEVVIAALTKVTGIGRWTAEIYAMFSLGRADVFAANDLALQEGARALFDLPERPSEKDLRALAEGWSPWRAVAARLLWAYYHVDKQREGIT